MNPIKVLHVHRDFAPDRGGGGVARHIHGIASIVGGPRFAVKVVAPGAVRSATSNSYDVERSGYAALPTQVRWADVVHLHGSRNPLAAWAWLLARLGGKRTVYTPHCYYDGGNRLKRGLKWAWDATVERILLAHSDSVVLLAAAWQAYLHKRGLSVRAPEIIPNCVLGTAVLAQGAEALPLAGSPALLSVGRLDRVKRLIDAISLLREPGFEAAVLHIVGTGPDRDRLERRAQAAGVRDRVVFHGFVPDETVASMAAGTDCFVMTSAAEGGPTVLIEMMLMGCPVVASDVPGNRAILEAVRGEGALFPCADIAALARTVARALTEPGVDSRREAARRTFTWERWAEAIAALYDPALGSGEHRD